MEVKIMSKRNQNKTEFGKDYDPSPDDLEIEQKPAKNPTINKKEILEREKGKPKTFR